ncbi:hypothetical protein [[Eubacterium] cellulosolvens]
MGETTKTNRGITLFFASCVYIAIGIYLLIFSIEHAVELWSLIILYIASILAGIGLFMLRRWSFWLALIVSPLLITVAASTLSFSMGIPSTNIPIQGTLFEVTLGVIIALAIISFLIVLANSDKLRKVTLKSSKSESD